MLHVFGWYWRRGGKCLIMTSCLMISEYLKRYLMFVAHNAMRSQMELRYADIYSRDGIPFQGDGIWLLGDDRNLSHVNKEDDNHLWQQCGAFNGRILQNILLLCKISKKEIKWWTSFDLNCIQKFHKILIRSYLNVSNLSSH